MQIHRFSLYTLVMAGMMLMSLSSCFTGVEGTKKINISKSERKALELTPEEKISSEVKAVSLSDWSPGRSFLAVDNRLALLLNPRGVSAGDSLKGKTLCFSGLESRSLPDGSQGAVLVFEVDGVYYEYAVNRRLEEARTGLKSNAIPMLVDLCMVEKMDSLLSNRELWTRSQLWYANDDSRFMGLKFVPVRVDSVVAGNSSFPMKVYFHDVDGRPAFMYMNFGHGGKESRSFDTLFSISDPRKRYPRIESEVWKLICNGAVRQGMTKEECRLALGAPSDVDGGNDWNRTLDVWKYPDGRYLVFIDGLLSEFRL